MPDLILYYFKSCPYCKKVLKYMKRNGLMEGVTLKNIREDERAREELIEKGGKEQVPCLFVDGKPLYESSDIISWFKNIELEK